MGLWADALGSAGLSFLICQMGFGQSQPRRSAVRVKWCNSWSPHREHLHGVISLPGCPCVSAKACPYPETVSPVLLQQLK